MIYEIRTYNVKPGLVGEYEKRFAEGLEVRSKYSSMYGMWHVEIGPLNQIVHIWSYDSLQQRAEVRAAASRDTSGKWPPNTNDLLVSQETDILVPVNGMQHLAGVQELGNVYELRMYTYPAGATGGVAETFAAAYPGRHEVYPVGGHVDERSGQSEPAVPAVPVQELGAPRSGARRAEAEGHLAAARRCAARGAAGAPHDPSRVLAAALAELLEKQVRGSTVGGSIDSLCLRGRELTFEAAMSRGVRNPWGALSHECLAESPR